jgi:pyrimidine deaminase RibD-like protein
MFKKDFKYLDMARQNARDYHGSVIVMNGRVVSKGYSHIRCKVGREYTRSCHAEIHALKRFKGVGQRKYLYS